MHRATTLEKPFAVPMAFYLKLEKMKIQLLSDIHVEFWRDHCAAARDAKLLSLIQPADVLVAAGDINTGRTNTLDTLHLFSNYYRDIIYFPGNHEYYHGLTIDEFDRVFEKELPDNVHMLNPGVLKIEDVTFVGATLWTNFGDDVLAEKEAKACINDFRRTRITTKDMSNAFYRDSQYIKHIYEETQGKIVIATHFLPALECISPRFRGPNLINRYFANDLGGWIETLENATWLFGHTHDSVDVTIGQTRCLAAPVGYPGEHQQSYEPLTFEL